jgi:hypothetical protein
MSAVLKVAAAVSVERRVDGYDWTTIGADLDAFGCATLQELLSPQECDDIAALYPHEEHFRSHIHMAQHGFGKGEYRYFKYPLPALIAFPLQVTVLLSAPGRNFAGGEFVLTEQRPRMQSRVEVVPLQQGDAVLFAVHNRPVQGTKGPYRVNLRHGVSRLRSGRRHTLGIIFHDAR